MKIKVILSKEKRQQFQEALQNQEIELSDDANIVVYELHRNKDYLLVKDDQEYMRILVEDIVYIEAYGNLVKVYTHEETYVMKETLYQLEADLYEKGFIRVHKAFIVNKKRIKRMRAGLNMKFDLLMSNAQHIEVSRSYYYQFKEEMGF